MPVFALEEDLYFPPTRFAENDGLLAVGGDLSPERLLLAYSKGIFPWYSQDPILWWSPDPRFVIFPEEFKVNKTVKSLLKKSAFHFTVNKHFEAVIRNCQQIERPGEEGTWINDNIIAAYCKLHEMGYGHSAEVWQNGELVGGLYGVCTGNVFCGESMFSKVSNASRYAFAQYVEVLKKENVQLIDCQVYSEYLESMGARMISREVFQEYLTP